MLSEIDIIIEFISLVYKRNYMYLEEIYLENTGPISKCHVKLPFADNGNPRPVVIVGPNGSGKSIFLSYIVDALTEFAKQAFHDIVPPNGAVTPYFRIIRPAAIRSGEPFSLSLLYFKTNDDSLYYCEKVGVLDPATYSPNVKSVFAPLWNWSTEGNHKRVLTGKEDDLIDDWLTGEIDTNVSLVGKIIKTEMRNGAYAFFPASRHEDPVWLNPRSLKVNMDVPVNRRFSTDLDKPLRVETCAERNISWILDVLFDAAVDFDILQKRQIGSVLSDTERMNWNNSQALQQARQNIEQILQETLQNKQAKLERGFRNDQEHRLAIRLDDGQVIPNLQSLSQGQSQLFHLFSTIIRYGERSDLNMSIRLSDITGLVIIDEIDAHLHPTLQYTVVPKLIKLFPKVQFIISSHSPLFLLGMEQTFDPDKVAILELPDGGRITSEQYPEFKSTFEYYQTTESFEEEIKQRFADMTKPVVLTEGKTDAQYIQTALELLGEQELLDSLEIRPVGDEGDGGDRGGGESGLDKFQDVYKVKSSFFHQPILLLYDWDAKKESDQIEKLWIRSIPKNDADAEEKRGIENLFSSHLFKDCFYEKKPKKGVHGKSNEIHEFKKPKFCDWICENGSANDFEGFKGIVNILKEFVEAHQLPSQPE